MRRDGPYPGLSPYDAEDAEFFFGREREARLIALNLLASPLTLLYGESGVGKSSVLRAGVVPAVTRMYPGTGVLVCKDWLDPIALGPAVERFGREAEGAVLMILDQFEEFFLYHPHENGAGPFAGELVRMLERPDVPVHFLISLRADALAELDRFKDRIPGLFDNYLRVAPLSRAAAREAIERPVDRYNEQGGPPVTIEPGLADAVLDQLVTDGAVDAPYLQLVMSRLWQEEAGSSPHTLRLETLGRMGGARRIADTHVDAVMTAFAPAERAVAARLFLQLVTPSGTKIAHLMSDLAQLAGEPEERVAAVVAKLAAGDTRILRPAASSHGGAARFEIFHDVLGQAVLDWRSRYEAGERERRVKEEQRKQLTNRFFRILALTLLLAVIGTALLTFWALDQRDAAQQGRQGARSSALAAYAIAELPSDPELAVLLAREALKTRVTAEGEATLANALSQMHLRAVMRGHSGGLRPTPDRSALTPDGSRVVTASEGGTAAIWEVATGRLVHALRGHRGIVNTAAFSPDGSVVVTAGQDRTARIWDARSGRLLHVLRGHRAPVFDASFSSDGRRIATAGGLDRTAAVWSASSGRLLHRLAAPAPVVTARFDPRGDRIVTGQFDGSARVFSATSGRLLGELRGHRAPVVGARFDPTGRRVLTVSFDGTARIWDVRTRRAAHVLRQPRAERAVFSADGRLVVTAGGTTARVWDAASGALVATLAGHDDTINTATFSPDGSLVVTAAEDETARIWDAATGGLLRTLSGHTDGVASALFTPSGRTVVSAGEDGTARTWDVDAGAVLRGHGDSVAAIAFSPDSGRVLTGSLDGTARVWDTRRARQVGGPLLHGPMVNSVAFSSDGTRLVTAGGPFVRLWDARSGRPLAMFRLPGEEFNSAALNPEGTTLVAAGTSGTATIWDVATKERIAVLRHAGSVTDVAYSPDGRLILTASLDRTARLSDAASGRQVAVLRGHRSGLYSAAISPDGRFAVTGSGDRTAIVWALPSGRRERELSGHAERVRSVAFSADGRRVVTAGDTTTRVWDVRSGRPLAILRMHAAAVNGVDVSRSGLIGSASADRTARLYRCRTCGSLRELEATAAEIVTRELTPAERARFAAR